MNKQGWTYKTFGEVGSFLRGKSIQKADFVEKGLPCIHYGQIHTKFGVSIDKHLSEIPLELYNKSIIASHGDVIIAITSEDLEGSCKSTAWLGDYDIAVSSHAAVYKHNLNPKFIAYYLRSKSFYYEKMKYARGFKVMEIKPTDIERIPIPVPPIAEQERIVAELDLLSGIIEKKKEQLKAYDQLAQSIFYTMFGDPIDNPKGWETKKLGEGLSYIKNGANIKQTKGASGIPITRIETLSGGVFNRDRLGYADILSTDKYSQYVMEDMDILMSHINSKAYIGRSVVYRKEGDETIIHGMNLLRLKVIPSLLSSVYLDFFFKSDYFKDRVARIRKDAVNQSSMAISDLVKIPICVPPLSLQQEFAEKVEAIERQKALVQQSIEETQTMFDYTMDKYFG